MVDIFSSDVCIEQPSLSAYFGNKIPETYSDVISNYYDGITEEIGKNYDPSYIEWGDHPFFAMLRLVSNHVQDREDLKDRLDLAVAQNKLILNPSSSDEPVLIGIHEFSRIFDTKLLASNIAIVEDENDPLIDFIRLIYASFCELIPFGSPIRQLFYMYTCNVDLQIVKPYEFSDKPFMYYHPKPVDADIDFINFDDIHGMTILFDEESALPPECKDAQPQTVLKIITGTVFKICASLSNPNWSVDERHMQWLAKGTYMALIGNYVKLGSKIGDPLHAPEMLAPEDISGLNREYFGWFPYYSQKPENKVPLYSDDPSCIVKTPYAYFKLDKSDLEESTHLFCD